MRTNIEIDDELMQKAMAATGATTKKATVVEALRLVVQLKQQGDALEGLWGLATWVGPDGDWFAVDPLAQPDENTVRRPGLGGSRPSESALQPESVEVSGAAR